MNWLTPWHPFSDSIPDDGLVNELKRELSTSHVLFGIPVVPIGGRQDCDDVLFRLLDGSNRLAVVHLTYSQHPESDPRWPETQLFNDWPDFEREVMLPDHNNWKT